MSGEHLNWKERILYGSSPRFRNHPGVTESAALAYARSCMKEMDFVLAGNTGCAAVTRLEFDSQHLGIPCGRIAYLGAQSEIDAINASQKAVELAASLGIDHLSVRCDANDTILLEALSTCGFVAVDSILTFTRSMQNYEPAAPDPKIRLVRMDEIEVIGEIARTAFSIDRFHSDPMIENSRADELHYHWGKNSVRGDAADAVVVAVDDNDHPVGFLTCKLSQGTYKGLGKYIGTIVLAATSEVARGKGFGGRMSSQALNWFLCNGCDIVEVGTQAVNKPAAGLYEGAGFQVSDHSVSMRKWIGTAPSIVETGHESAKILL